jgi:hypothetical protein
VSLMLFDQRGSSLRTCLLCALAESTGYSGTWSESATSAGRLWWVLTTWEPRTDASGCGSWQRWQTPLSEGMTKGVEYQYDQGDKNKPRATLLGQCTGWQTPTSADGGSTSRGGARKGELLLGGQVKAWPTPETGHSLNGDGARGGRVGNGYQSGQSLEAVASAWATPNQRDWKDTGPTQGNRKSPNVGTQAHQCVGQQDRANSNTHGKPRGSLNPAWVAQLMGYPSGWLDLPVETLLELWATRKCRKSSKSLRGGS